MLELPIFIESFLVDNNFKFINLIQKNDWKKTYIIKIKNQNQSFILKAYSEDSPVGIKNKFQNEKNFYLKNQGVYIPELIISTKNIIVIKYINGFTLREALKLKKVNERIIDNIFNNINGLYIENKKLNISADYSFKNAFIHLSSLIFSGPVQTNKNKNTFVKNIVLKIINRILTFMLKKVIKEIDISNLKEGFSHGDLHYNNILISNQEIKFIDFENIKYNDFFDFDILYLLVMIEINIEKNTTVSIFFKKKLSKYLGNNQDLIKLYNIYKIAISINKKYHLKELTI